MNYKDLDTPALIIDREIMMDNLKTVQDYADKWGVSLRPHTKTHKTPEIAKLQEKLGAKGIAVAKLGEAEVMAENGLKDIQIVNQVVGTNKLERIRKLSENGIDISFGLDSIEQAAIIQGVFKGSERPAEVVVEIEVGERRSGVIEKEAFRDLLNYLSANCPDIHLKGIFSHDGNSYNAKDLEECKDIHLSAQHRTVEFANLAREMGFDCEQVSIGSSPSLLNDFPIIEGVTEIRPGTYVFMDASMNNATTHCRPAASVLAQVISRPTDERVILDVGAKGITMQRRTEGITAVEGLGQIKQFPGVNIYDVYDEHAIIYDKHMRDSVKVGDKVEIIPVHICPVTNLYEKLYIVSEGEVIEELEIKARAKLS